MGTFDIPTVKSTWQSLMPSVASRDRENSPGNSKPFIFNGQSGHSRDRNALPAGAERSSVPSSPCGTPASSCLPPDAESQAVTCRIEGDLEKPGIISFR